MIIPKLTNNEIHQKIALFSLRKETLVDIVKEMDDIVARKALEVQIQNYEKSLDLLYAELNIRSAAAKN